MRNPLPNLLTLCLALILSMGTVACGGGGSGTDAGRDATGPGDSWDPGTPADPGILHDPGTADDSGAQEDPGTLEDPGTPEDPGVPEDPGAEHHVTAAVHQHPAAQPGTPLRRRRGEARCGLGPGG